MFGKALCDVVNGEEVAGLSLCTQLPGIEKLSRTRDEHGFEVASAEAYACRIRHRQGNYPVDPAIRSITHHPATREECCPEPAINIDACAVGPLSRSRVVCEKPPVADRAFVRIEIEAPCLISPRIREIERAIVGRKRNGTG